MKRVVLASLATLASCATPPNVTLANKVDLDGPKASFRNCRVSVSFSGAPRAMHANEASAYTTPLGREAKWQVDGLTHQEFRLVETALCICRDSAFSDGDIDLAERRMASNTNIRLLPAANPPSMRKTIGLDAPFARGESEERVLLMYPAKARRCVFVQGGKFAPTTPNAVKTFFATLEPIGE